MRNIIPLTLFVILIFISNRSPSFAVDYQFSTSVSVILGVRDKWGGLGSYTAKFVFACSDKKQYKLTTHGNGNGWIYVKFPNDFRDFYINASTSSFRSPQRCSWKCFIGSETIEGEAFAWNYLPSRAEVSN